MTKKRFYSLLGLCLLLPVGVFASHFYWVEYSDFMWLDDDHCLVKIAWNSDATAEIYDEEVVLVDVRTKSICPVYGRFQAFAYGETDDRIFLAANNAVALFEPGGGSDVRLRCLWAAPPSVSRRLTGLQWLYGSVLALTMRENAGDGNARLVFDYDKQKTIEKAEAKTSWYDHPCGRPPAGSPFSRTDDMKYFVQASINKVRANALAAAAALKAKNQPACVLLKDEFYYVRAGPYDFKNEASEALTALKQSGYPDAFLLSELFYLGRGAREGMAVSESNIWLKNGQAYLPLFEDAAGVEALDAVNGRLYFLRKGELEVMDLATRRVELPTLRLKGSDSRDETVIGPEALAGYQRGKGVSLPRKEMAKRSGEYAAKMEKDAAFTPFLLVPNRSGGNLVVRFKRLDWNGAILSSVSFRDKTGKETPLFNALGETGT